MSTEHLPPLPWTYMVTARPGEHEGSGHVYIVDANGRKIANLWGNRDEKLATLAIIMDAAGKAETPPQQTANLDGAPPARA
jgi:hypothetical protein